MIYTKEELEHALTFVGYPEKMLVLFYTRDEFNDLFELEIPEDKWNATLDKIKCDFADQLIADQIHEHLTKVLV